MKNKDDIYQRLHSLLEEMFEIESAAIRPDAHLYHDLDIDSIDAVDLVVELKKITGKKIKPEDFKEVRTVQDVVDAVDQLLQD